MIVGPRGGIGGVGAVCAVDGQAVLVGACVGLLVFSGCSGDGGGVVVNGVDVPSLGAAFHLKASPLLCALYQADCGMPPLKRMALCSQSPTWSPSSWLRTLLPWL